MATSIILQTKLLNAKQETVHDVMMNYDVNSNYTACNAWWVEEKGHKNNLVRIVAPKNSNRRIILTNVNHMRGALPQSRM